VGRMKSIRILKYTINIGATQLQWVKKTALRMGAFISYLKIGMGRCTPLEYTYFIISVFVKCYSVLGVAFIYCRYKSAV
jgi:hypothetical protein